MALTVPETIGFCEEVVQFMTSNSAALTAKGVDRNYLDHGIEHAIGGFGDPKTP